MPLLFQPFHFLEFGFKWLL